MELMYQISRKEKMNRKKCMGVGWGGVGGVDVCDQGNDCKDENVLQ